MLICVPFALLIRPFHLRELWDFYTFLLSNSQWHATSFVFAITLTDNLIQCSLLSLSHSPPCVSLALHRVVSHVLLSYHDQGPLSGTDAKHNVQYFKEVLLFPHVRSLRILLENQAITRNLPNAATVPMERHDFLARYTFFGFLVRFAAVQMCQTKTSVE